jgi:hypothetical protein
MPSTSWDRQRLACSARDSPPEPSGGIPRTIYCPVPAMMALASGRDPSHTQSAGHVAHGTSAFLEDAGRALWCGALTARRVLDVASRPA